MRFYYPFANATKPKDLYRSWLARRGYRFTNDDDMLDFRKGGGVEACVELGTRLLCMALDSLRKLIYHQMQLSKPACTPSSFIENCGIDCAQKMSNWSAERS